MLGSGFSRRVHMLTESCYWFVMDIREDSVMSLWWPDIDCKVKWGDRLISQLDQEEWYEGEFGLTSILSYAVYYSLPSLFMDFPYNFQ